jgi:hypothetical protein
MWEDSMAAEGWGLYAEALMAEPQPGAAAGFYTPEERLYQLQGKLFRDLRVRIDSGLHTGRLGYDAATTLYSEVVDFLPGPCVGAAGKPSEAKRASCEAAERAIFRYPSGRPRPSPIGSVKTPSIVCARTRHSGWPNAAR